MRILYHHRTLADGAEGIHIAEMVSAFRDAGHSVRVMGLASPQGAADGSGLVAGLRRHLHGPALELAAVACNGAEYMTVRRAIREFRPDLLYKRHARSDVAALTAARSCSVPAALEVNCLYTTPSYLRFEPLKFRRIAASLERRALALASVVFAVSSPLAAEISGLGAYRVEVLPNGANPLTFRPAALDSRSARARLGLPEALTLGWAGIIRDWHGLELLLDVLEHVPEVRLLVVGDGPGRGMLEAEAARRRLADRLVVTGRIAHGKMPEYLQAVDVAVVAAERTGIASPMKLLEYMAMALTVVAPDAPNIRDLVTHGVEAQLFRAGDPDDLAGVIARLSRSPDLRRRLGENARRKIERERNWRRNGEIVMGCIFGGAATEPASGDGSLKGMAVHGSGS